jgi:hypothetical protein
MTGNEHVTAEIGWLSRRGRAAAPGRHPLRTPACPPLGALARGALTEAGSRHAEACRHCRSVRRAGAAERNVYAGPAVGAIAAAMALAVFLSGWRQPEPPRFAPPAARVVEPAPRAIVTDWPAPRLPGLRALTPPTAPALPVIRPLERFEPPLQTSAPAPIAALGGPTPPVLDPAPPPDVVGMLGLRIL